MIRTMETLTYVLATDEEIQRLNELSATMAVH